MNLITKMQWKTNRNGKKMKFDFNIAWKNVWKFADLTLELIQSIVMIWGVVTDMDLISSMASSSGKEISSRDAVRSSSLTMSSRLATSLLGRTTVSASLRSKKKT